jgi:O-antigen biosynthesis protein
VERIEASGSAGELNGSPVGHDRPIPACSIVIPTYNGVELLRSCLASIARHWPSEPAYPIEVIVADDASTDGTVGWLSETHPGVRLVRLERNGGFCAAANAGMAAARGRFIQLLNNDTEVTAGWVEAGLAPFADETVGSVAPLVLVRADPSRVDSAGDTYALVGWPAKRGHGQPADVWAAHPVDEVFGASGSSAFYRTEALCRAGAFDPIFGSYYEDIDLAFRLRWAGYRCEFTPGCRILHDVSATYDHRNPKLQRRMSRNAELVFWSNLPARTLVLALLPHLAFIAAQAAWRLARGRLSPFVAGKVDAIRAWRQIRERRLRRSAIARSAVRPPHFVLTTGSIDDVRNHLRRPLERSRSRAVSR